MTQTSVFAAPAQVGVTQVDGSRAGNDARDTAIRSRYKDVRSSTSALAVSMSAEDQMVQSCPEASPMKWHQAHTTWFFETFVLRPFLTDYKPCGRSFVGYSIAITTRSAKRFRRRACAPVFSRPSLDEVHCFPRMHVDQKRWKSSCGRRR